MSDVFLKSQFPEVFLKVQQLPQAQSQGDPNWLPIAFENDLIGSEDYLAKAQNFYGLAILKDSFFTEQFTPTLYEKYKSAYSWGPQAIPVFEWDGVLFVACLEPQNVPTHLEILCRPILASYEGLSWAWRRMGPAEISPEAPLPPVAETQELSESLLSSATRSTERGDSPSVSSNTLPPPPQAKEGNLFELVDMTDSSEGLETETKEATNEEAPTEEAAFEMPEGLNFSAAPTERAAEGSPLNFGDFSSAMSLPEPPLMARPQPQEESPFLAPPSLPKPPSFLSEDRIQAVPPAPPEALGSAPKMAFAPSSDLEATIIPAAAKGALAPPPPPTAKMPPPPPPINKMAEVTQTQNALTPPSPQQEIEEELMLCFAKAYQTYKNLMILKVRGDQAIPFRWDPSYNAPRSISPISLKDPSIFRISAKTQKPFHGSVTPNPTNNRFFELWFGGQRPAYLTIIPLFFDGDLVGLLLAGAPEELDRKSSLELMQTTAKKVESNFGARIAA